MAAEADGVQGASVAEGDFAVVDFVGADAVVGPVWGFVRGSGFGSGGVGRGGGASVEGAVGSVVVVLVAELVEECLEVGQCRWLLWLAGEPGFRVCWKRSTLPWVWGWLPRPFF